MVLSLLREFPSEKRMSWHEVVRYRDNELTARDTGGVSGASLPAGRERLTGMPQDNDVDGVQFSPVLRTEVQRRKPEPGSTAGVDFDGW